MTKRRQTIIIGIIGALLIIIAMFVAWHKTSLHQTSWWVDFLFLLVSNVAFLLVGICIANVIWNLLGGDPSERLIEQFITSSNLLVKSIDAGLTDIRDKSSSFASSDEWLQIIAKSKTEICLQGYTLFIWTNSAGFKKTLIDLAKKGVRIRLVFMDENAQYLEAGINSSIGELSKNRVESDIISMTSYLDAVKNDLQKEKKVKGSLDYRKIKKGVITSQLVIADNIIHYTPYLVSVNTSDSPIFIIKNKEGKLYDKFKNEFETVWEYDN